MIVSSNDHASRYDQQAGPHANSFVLQFTKEQNAKKENITFPHFELDDVTWGATLEWNKPVNHAPHLTHYRLLNWTKRSRCSLQYVDVDETTAILTIIRALVYNCL